ALEGRPYEREFRYRDRDWLALFAPWRTERGVEGVIVVTRDITAQKQAEAERMQRLAAQMRAQRWEDLGMIAGGVAHDLNNLLAIVLGQAEHLAETCSEFAPAVRPIMDAAQKGGALCRALLAFAGKGGGKREKLHPRVLVEGVWPLLCASAPPQVRIERDVPERMPLVEGDAVQLRQALFNIAHNAVQAVAEAGGVVRVEARPIDGAALDWDAHNQPQAKQAVVFTIRDDGPGIPPELQARIFLPFFTTKAEGTGLGLAVAEGAVRAHGGWIELESAPGEGATFRIVLPAFDVWQEADLAEPEKQRAPQAAQGAGRVALVADDEPLVRRLTARVLAQMGFSVLEAEDGEQAVEIARAHPEIELAVVDMRMPKMNGDAALAEIKRMRPDLKAVILSGYADDPKRANAHADAWLMKPVRRKELQETIARVLDA
ncbi:MAG: response regulator, partial [Zetaproteobacteria bacterium]